MYIIKEEVKMNEKYEKELEVVEKRKDRDGID